MGDLIFESRGDKGKKTALSIKRAKKTTKEQNDCNCMFCRCKSKK